MMNVHEIFFDLIFNPTTLLTVVVSTYRTFRRYSNFRDWRRSFFQVTAFLPVYLAGVYLWLKWMDLLYFLFTIDPFSYIGIFLAIPGIIVLYGSPLIVTVWIGMFVGRILGLAIEKSYARLMKRPINKSR